jgi:hypothetical protein
VHPAEVAGAFHTEHMAPGGRASWPATPGHLTARPACPAASPTPTARWSTTAARCSPASCPRSATRCAGTCAWPRWPTSASRRHRAPAGRHAHRPGQARPARRRDPRAEDPRRPPDAAWRLVASTAARAHGDRQPTWRLLVAPAKGTFRAAHRRGRATRSPPGARVGASRPLRDDLEPVGPARRHRRRVARRGRRPGRPRPAPRAPAPRRQVLAHERDRSARRPKGDPVRPASCPSAPTARAGRHQRRDLRAHRLLRRVDPRALRHRRAPLRRPRRERRRHGRGRRRGSPWMAGHRPDQDRRHRRHGHPPLPDPVAPPPSSPPARRRPRAAAFDISAPRAPASATARRWPTTWSAPAAPSTCSSSASRSSPTSSTPTDRGTAFIFADGAGAVVVGPSDERGHRPGRLGLGRLAVGRDHHDAVLDRRTARRPGRAGPTSRCRASRCSAGPCGEMAGRPARPSTRRGHRRRPRRLHPPPGQHAHHRRHGQALKLPRHVAVARDIETPATPRPPRSRWRWTGCSRRRPGTAAAASRCSSASAPAWPTRPRSSSPALHTSRRPAPPHDPTVHRPREHGATTRSSTHGFDRAGDPQRPRRHRQRGSPGPRPTTSSPTSPSPTTSTSTRCRWSRSSWPPRTSSA